MKSWGKKAEERCGLSKYMWEIENCRSRQKGERDDISGN